MSISNQNFWPKAIALAAGVWAMTASAAEIPLTRRAHMDAATQKLYDRIRSISDLRFSRLHHSLWPAAHANPAQ